MNDEPEERNAADDCQACNARPDQCSRVSTCCEDCNHSACWSPARTFSIRLTPEQKKERERIRQARLARSVTDIANEMELAARRQRISDVR